MMHAIFTVLKKGSYLSIFLFVSIAFFALFILIPVFTVTGNDLAFQLSTFSFGEYALMVLLALLIGLTFSLQVYTLKNKKTCSGTAAIAQGATTGISGAFAAIIGTAFCASCLVPLFAAIGLGGGSVFFVLEHQTYFLISAIALMLISLYFALRKATGINKQNSKLTTPSMKTTSKFTCPECSHSEEVEMPTIGCQHFYQCTSCKATIEPKVGDCCVFCSYGDTKCPIEQK